MSCPKKSTPSEESFKRSSGNMFSQLRHLAGQLETGIQNIQQELDRPKGTAFDGRTKHTGAINFLLHTKKDMTELKDEAVAMRTEFSKGNTKFNRISELMKSFLEVQSERIENIESYLEKYGYKRSVFESEKSAKDDKVESDCGSNGSEENNEDDAEVEENDMNNSCKLDDDDEDQSSKSLSPTLGSEKPGNFQIIKTPKLEDFYKNLSEDTISLFKHGVRGRSQNEGSALKDNTFFQRSSINSAGLSLGDNSHSQSEFREQYPLIPPSNYTDNYEVSIMKSQKPEVTKNTTVTYGSPELPKLLTSGSELTSASKKTTGEKTFYPVSDLPMSSSKDRFYSRPRTPEPPALLSEFFTFNNHARKFETEGHTRAPETPKLLTPGFKLNSFATRDLESAASTVTETAVPCVPMARALTTMKSPEEPKLLTQELKQSDFVTNPRVRSEGKSAKSLFNTPPKPELMSSYLPGSTAVADCKENIKNSKFSYLSTPEPPKLLSCDNNFSRSYPHPTDIYWK